MKIANHRAELRAMSDEQLALALTEAQTMIFRLRFQAATDRVEAANEVKKMRRSIARIMTLQRQRVLAATPKA
jgi:large subunit ribosomal protein L29